MLNFICKMTLDGRATELNEQKIGVEVFGRSPAYNAADDSIVRAQARLLRQKLEEYFEHECPHTTEVIVIPKGGYVPIFRPRGQPAEAGGAASARVQSVAVTGPSAEQPSQVSPPVTPPAMETAVKPSAWLRRWRAAFALVAVLGVIAGIWLTGRRGSAHQTTVVDALWSAVFLPDQPTLIVPSDDGLVLYQEMTHNAVTLSDYLDGAYLRRATASPRDALAFDPQWFAAHQYTSSADLNLTLRLSRLPEAARAQVEASNARELRLETLKTRNVILIGGPGSNPWVGLFADRLNFQLGWNWTSGEGFVQNSHPAAGEPPLYRDVLLGSTRRSYGLLAFLPGVDGNPDDSNFGQITSTGAIPARVGQAALKLTF